MVAENAQKKIVDKISSEGQFSGLKCLVDAEGQRRGESSEYRINNMRHDSFCLISGVQAIGVGGVMWWTLTIVCPSSAISIGQVCHVTMLKIISHWFLKND